MWQIGTVSDPKETTEVHVISCECSKFMHNHNIMSLLVTLQDFESQWEIIVSILYQIVIEQQQLLPRHNLEVIGEDKDRDIYVNDRCTSPQLKDDKVQKLEFESCTISRNNIVQLKLLSTTGI